MSGLVRAELRRLAGRRVTRWMLLLTTAVLGLVVAGTALAARTSGGLDLQAGFDRLVAVFTAVAAVSAFVVGASYVGADWRDGGMATLFVWRPRRWQVLMAKLGALLVGLAAAVVPLTAAWTGALWLVAGRPDAAAGMTAQAWWSTGLTGLRAVVLVLLAGAAGFLTASIGRHTAAALGTALAAGVVAQVAVPAVVDALGVRYPDAWRWTTWPTAWLRGSVPVADAGACPQTGATGCAPLEITWQTAGLGMAALALLLVVVAIWQAHRRDVV